MPKKKQKKGEKFDLDFSIEEDALLRGLIDSKGKKVEIIAFGIVYSGVLEHVDLDGGQIVIADNDDRATIEIERIESLTPLENYL
ncbi:MAG: hypothetical protein WC683_09195 [bacterium]